MKRVRHTEPPAPPLAEPARAPYEHSIGARGIVESMDENVRIAPAVAGLVSKVKVKVGDRVKAGDVLLEQDTRDATASVSAQEAQLVSMRAQIDEAEVQSADQKDQWERMEKLSANSVASIDERQRARFAVEPRPPNSPAPAPAFSKWKRKSRAPKCSSTSSPSAPRATAPRCK